MLDEIYFDDANMGWTAVVWNAESDGTEYQNANVPDSIKASLDESKSYACEVKIAKGEAFVIAIGEVISEA